MAEELGRAEEPVQGAQAIRRSVRVIRAVAELQRTGASATRVARATGLSRPTAFRILRSLAEERMLRVSEDGRTFWIGQLVYELGLAATPHAQPEERWHAAVEHVAARTRLTSYLIGQSGDEAVCLICVQGAAAIRAMPIDVGQRVPLGIGAGSLAILASFEDEQVRRILAGHRRRVNAFPGGAHFLDGLLERVERTRNQGYSLSSGTVAKGVSGVGVVVPASGPSPRLAITVSAVAEAISDNDARQLAAEISTAVQRWSGSEDWKCPAASGLNL